MRWWRAENARPAVALRGKQATGQDFGYPELTTYLLWCTRTYPPYRVPGLS